MEPILYFTRLVSLILLLILGTTTIWRFFSLFYKTGFDIRSMISQQSFRPGSLTRNYLIYSFPAINSAVKIIFCISVVKKTDLGYVNKYIDATLIFYMYVYICLAICRMQWNTLQENFTAWACLEKVIKTSGEKSI